MVSPNPETVYVRVDMCSCAYMYFIKTSRASVPPGALYIRLRIGDMSDCRIDWRISITTAR